MATGVLIIGVGKGTKQLQQFLECTKSYEATVLFGVATDTYDAVGKVLSKAPYSHVTREGVERALEKFKGRIMQRPPLYSALRVQGKRLYEYAREGKEVPVEIQERPVEVKELEIMEWLSPGSHNYQWPTEEAPTEEKEVAEKLLQIINIDGSSTERHGETDELRTEDVSSGTKRKRLEDEDDIFVSEKEPALKRHEDDSKLCMSGGLPPPEDIEIAVPEPVIPTFLSNNPDKEAPAQPEANPPAVKLRMTVTSGFYVRSLSHDLGAAMNSLAIMSQLVRTSQGIFELGRNVLDYEDLGKGEEVWGPKVERMLEKWNERDGRTERNSSSEEGMTVDEGGERGGKDGDRRREKVEAEAMKEESVMAA